MKVAKPMHSKVKYIVTNILLVLVWSLLVGLIVISENNAHENDYQLYTAQIAEWLDTEDEMSGMKQQFALPKKVKEALQLRNQRRLNNYWIVWFLGLIFIQIGFFIVINQFGKRKRDKNKAEQSQEKYKNLSSLSFEGIFVHENGVIKDLNDAVVRILGFSKEELLNYNIINIVKTDADQRLVNEKLEKDYSEPYEVTVVCKDGSDLTVEVQSHKLNTTRGFDRVTAIRDISKRKAAENDLILKNQELASAEEEIRASNEELVATNEALKENMQDLESAEEKTRTSFIDLQEANKSLKKTEKDLQLLNVMLQLVIDNIPVRVFWKDLNEKYLGCNNLFAQDANCISVEEVIGKTVEGLYDGELGRYYAIQDEQVVRSKKAILNKVEIEEHNGVKKYFRLNRIPLLNKKNAVIGVLGTYENITEIKEIEQELRLAKERAVESDRLKSAFLANMSHEIRTPMNAIIGFSQLLNLGSNVEPKQLEFIEVIQRSGDQLLSLIDDILDISKIETGQVVLKRDPVDVNQLLKNLESTFSLKAANNNNQLLLITNTEDISILVETDKTRLRQLLSNLLTNALKFTQEGQVEFGYKLVEEELVFFVKDTGCGMDETELEKIFERFHQSKNDYQAENNGVGLGLSICKGIIQLLDGEIWAESTLGKGSTFYFSLPMQISPDSKGLIKEEPISYQMGRMSILVAEDNLVNYKVIEALLASKQVRLFHACNGQQALDIYKENPAIDLVLMDIKMPEMDGLQTTLILKGKNPELPIIAQTAFALTEDKEEYKDARFDAYLTKPLKRDELYATIKRVMMNRSLKLD